MPPSGSGAQGDGNIPQPRVAQKEEGVCTCGKKWNRNFLHLRHLRIAVPLQPPFNLRPLLHLRSGVMRRPAQRTEISWGCGSKMGKAPKSSMFCREIHNPRQGHVAENATQC